MPRDLALIVDEIKKRYGCHTIILYGSRAMDAQSDSSDYDILGVRECGENVHDAREFLDATLDAFISSEADLKELKPEAIRFRHGRVLIEKDSFGQSLIRRAGELFAKGPEPLSPTESKTLQSWVIKMMSRVSRGGQENVESNYRRVWLQFDLLKIYFKLRGIWYLGPKESFVWLRKNDPNVFELFEKALAPDASRGSLRLLADRVITLPAK